ncbi:hypothetical protein COY90_01260 [Candidatus Roizmanbacteria bacterium CG_4_10_14_0_8_um_filter_39_9]|uniref:Cohesin domain-containing protein n=1 Tax=Candidatus Roizmanbacteria bacterium CG_4_10_14_0_8_um_filter_39_9 TaxID=1974829 RepID=A0A2M7QEL9_9BACT|nr:MAG: hypothetical protein COY90_01260 [Candidatus Roizmanbacteria bacterium CG_4_10_14_0_8_um_filter_39_9]
MRTCIRKYFIFLFLLFLSLVSVERVEAASLRFGTTTVSTNANQTFTTDVVVDAGTDQVTSSDIWVVYDPTYLEAQTVTSGTYFPAVTNNITSGKVSITGLIVDPGTYKTGNGVIATITFKGLKNGNTNVTFDCRTDVSNSSKIIKNDINATNIIVCSENGQLAVGIGVAANSSSSGYVPVANPTLPSSLPQTGIAENIVKFAAPGIILLFIGGMLRFIL